MRRFGLAVSAVLFLFGCSSGEGEAQKRHSLNISPPVESQVPEAPAVVIEADSDSDRDGVPDHLDKCPNTPWGPVDARGCPQDSDGDGVPDYLDECSDTSPGGKVDVRGCPEDRSFRIGIEFISALSEIDPRHHEEMKKAADYIQALPAGPILIEGHTDSVGPADYNEELSAKRAEKVRAYLIDKFDIPSARLEASGFGEMQPLGDNSTQEGRQQNRRVIIRSAN